MNRLIIIVIVFIGLCLNSCARMVVNVSTADSDRVQKVADSLRYRNLAFAYTDIKIQVLSCGLFDEKKINKAFSIGIDEAIASGEIDASDKANLLNNVRKSLTIEISKIKSIYLEGILLTDKYEYKDAVDKFWGAVEASRKLETMVIDELSIGAAGLINLVDCFKQSVIDAPKKTKDNLLGDPLVSYITKEKNEDLLWESNYNTTKSSTFFGNSDIAVVLAEDPESYNNNYSIKGVRVDADKLIQSSFDMLAQSINVVASTQGISLPDKGETNYFYPEIATEIKNLASEENKLDSKRKEFEAYKKLLLLEILSKELDTKKDDELKKAIEQIKSLWASYKAKMIIQLSE